MTRRHRGIMSDEKSSSELFNPPYMAKSIDMVLYYLYILFVTHIGYALLSGEY